MYSQIRIGGGVSIGVSIDLPIPDIVIVAERSETPRPGPRVRCRQAVIHTCDHSCFDSLGTINHQNGPNGRYIYKVTEASLLPIDNGEEKVVYHLDTGEILEIIISTLNPSDYNYQYYDPSCQNCQDSNSILLVLLNNEELPLRNGSLSLQPLGNGQFRNVINIHSVYEGNFNGSINF